MVSALITFVRSLFYNFNNDTVPFFSIMISSAVSLFCIALCTVSGICIINYIKSDKRNRQLIWLSISFLLNLVFSAVCLFIHHSQLKITVIYLLMTTLLSALSFFCQQKTKP